MLQVILIDLSSSVGMSQTTTLVSTNAPFVHHVKSKAKTRYPSLHPTYKYHHHHIHPLFSTSLKKLSHPCLLLSCSIQRSGYGHDGIYRSLKPSVVLPNDPNLSLVSFLFDSVSSFPNKTALIDADSSQTLSFAQIKSQVAKLAHGFLHLGINKNDVILLFMHNNIHFPICFLAATAIGAIVSTVNPVYTIAELTKQVNDSNPKLVITVPKLWNKMKGFNLPTVIIGSENATGSNVTSFYALMEVAGPVMELPKNEVKQGDTAVLLYSSGTTGMSKGIRF